MYDIQLIDVSSLVLPLLRRMYQIVYHYDSHCRSSIIGGNDTMFYMMVARAEHVRKLCLSGYPF